MIAPVRPGGRPRKTEMRAAMNAILYLLRTGCTAGANQFRVPNVHVETEPGPNQ